MKAPQLSSGNLLADRRADYAEMLFQSGDHKAGADLMRGALELTPQWALGWFRLGEMHHKVGAINAAEEAWRMALKVDPQDRAGATLKLELIGRAPASTAPPSAFVETLFDHYAKNFDRALVDKLEYRAPELLFEAIAKSGRARFAHAVDLGCGTGLMGEKLRQVCDFLEGYDISAAMLQKAEAKGDYDRLTKADLQSFSLPAGQADLVTAADVFMYFGALEGIFSNISAGLAKDGLFGFSLEKHNGSEPFLLQDTRRYQHSRAYVERILKSSGFAVISLEEGTVRQNRNQPVGGLVVVATKA